MLLFLLLIQVQNIVITNAHIETSSWADDADDEESSFLNKYLPYFTGFGIFALYFLINFVFRGSMSKKKEKDPECTFKPEIIGDVNQEIFENNPLENDYNIETVPDSKKVMLQENIDNEQLEIKSTNSENIFEFIDE